MNAQEYIAEEESLMRSTALERAKFIRKTYAHLALAILAFAAAEAMLMSSKGAVDFARQMSEYWLVALAIFMGLSALANSWAASATSKGIQYAGLALYVVIEAVIFLPLMLVAESVAPEAITQAAVLTLALVAGLTCTVFMTQADFSFLRSGIVIFSWLALGLIVCAVLFNFNLGLWFSLAMLVLAGAAILYQTSAVFREYETDQYVAAALGLFAWIALMYYYILRIFIRRN